MGRGNSGKNAADRAIQQASGGVFQTATPRVIKTFRRSLYGGYYRDNVLEATADRNGNVTFSYTRGEFGEKTSRTTTNVEYRLIAGAINGETFNINWDKVQSVSGETYSLRSEAKKNGLKWNGTLKRWERR